MPGAATAAEPKPTMAAGAIQLSAPLASASPFLGKSKSAFGAADFISSAISFSISESGMPWARAALR